MLELYPMLYAMICAAIAFLLIYSSIKKDIRKGVFFKEEEKKYLTHIRVNYENGTTVELNLSDSPRILAHCKRHNHYYTKWGSNTCRFCWQEDFETNILKQFKNGRRSKTKSRD